MDGTRNRAGAADIAFAVLAAPLLALYAALGWAVDRTERAFGEAGVAVLLCALIVAAVLVCGWLDA